MPRPFKLSVFFIIAILIFTPFALPLLNARQQSMNAAELYQAIKKLNTLGSVLYFAAHPDDENNPLLACFSNEMMLRTAYLSLTRGDGGQNLIGIEKGALIGLIRTQELLRAREMEKSEQFFSRAIDFGYTKNADETLRFWDHEKVLADAVFVIRMFRPDIIITRFPTTGEGRHGQHTASAIIAEEAFDVAGDYDRFPEQLQYVSPWQPKKLFWNAWEQVLPAKNIDTASLPMIDAGVYNSVLGKSYAELGAESRSRHKSQAMGTAKKLGSWPSYFVQIKGLPVRRSLFDDIDISWRRIPGSEPVARHIQNALKNYDPQKRETMLPELLAAYRALDNLPKSFWGDFKKEQLAEIIRECAGLKFFALAADYTAVPGGEIKITSTAISRCSIKVNLVKCALILPQMNLLSPRELPPNEPETQTNSIRIADDAAFSQPYWMESTPQKGLFPVADPAKIGRPLSPSSLQVRFTFSIDGAGLSFITPVQFKWLDQRDGDKFRDVIIAPPVTLHFDERVHVFTNTEPVHLRVTVKSNIDNVRGQVSLSTPAGWQVSPTQIFAIGKKYEEQRLEFSVTAPQQGGIGSISASVEFAGKIYTQQQITIAYDHIPIQNVLRPAALKAVCVPLKKRSRRLAYISGAGDEIPEILRSIGYAVEMLSSDDLDKKDLSPFDAIIAGVRAYNTRPELAQKNSRLLDYVKNGGTYVVQYNTSYALQTEAIGPYPFTISHDRVTVEEAPMQMLDSNHPVFNTPNKITAADFAGWVQERGLYFSDKWDARYRPLLGCNDPGEEQKRGSLLYTRYGKGVFIYTGLSFFRQLPAGVPGAYRLFVNLIEAGKRIYER